MIRLVIDTNVLVAAAYNPGSASRKIVSGVEVGTFELIVSPDIVREYERVFPKAIRSGDARARVWQSIRHAESVTPAEVPYVTADRSDDKFLAADAIITSDEHLLAVHPYEGIEILRPVVFGTDWEMIASDRLRSRSLDRIGCSSQAHGMNCLHRRI